MTDRRDAFEPVARFVDPASRAEVGSTPAWTPTYNILRVIALHG